MVGADPSLVPKLTTCALCCSPIHAITPMLATVRWELLYMTFGTGCKCSPDTLVQGLNFVTGLLLLILQDPEAVFWMLVVLSDSIIPGFYSRDMIALRADQEVLNRLVRDRLPLIHAHFERMGLALPLITTQWFIALYIDSVPVETVLRIWDVVGCIGCG